MCVRARARLSWMFQWVTQVWLLSLSLSLYLKLLVRNLQLVDPKKQGSFSRKKNDKQASEQVDPTPNIPFIFISLRLCVSDFCRSLPKLPQNRAHSQKWSFYTGSKMKSRRPAAKNHHPWNKAFYSLSLSLLSPKMMFQCLRLAVEWLVLLPSSL